MFVSQASGFVNPPANNNVVAPQHVQYLKDRAVDPDWAAYSAGVRTVSPDEGARLLGYPIASSGLLVPYPNAPGYVRVRLDDGGGYRVPANVEVPIYIPPYCQLEGDLPLFVVEGPVKALALQDHGFNTIALGGVATTLKKDHTLNDSWRQVALVRREVVLLFDANRAYNFEVARAEARLVLALEQAGAKVRVGALPLREGWADQGPDDFIAAHDNDVEPLKRIVSMAALADPVERAKSIGTNDQALELLENLPFLVAVKERGVVVQAKVGRALRVYGITAPLLRRALKEAEEKKKDTPEEPHDLGATSSRYEVREGGLCRVQKPDGVTEVVERLSNFTAHVVEDRTLDDGAGEPSRVFVLEGVLYDGTWLPRISVNPSDLNSDTWVTQKWGSRAIVGADVPRPAHHLLNAIKTVSQPVATIAYAHTGFRQIDGEWVYLHGGGAVGNANVLLDLNGSLARFALPETIEDAGLAVTRSMGFIEVAAERITRPLLSAVYRAPLNEALSCDAAITLYGGSGSLKSTVAALAQSHYGSFEHNSLPLSWESTANALELALFRSKDALVTIDDYVPKANQFDEIYRKAERVLRAIGNGSARGRLRSDTSERPDRPCRALVVITGEDLPKGESIQARLVAISMKRDDVALAKITTLQAEQHRLPQALRAYIEWLRPQMSQLKTEVLEKYREFRSQIHLAALHLRAPSAIAHLLVGAYYFGEFAKDVGVMTDAQAKAHVEATRSALLENARDQARATERSNPARRFVEILRSLYVGGRFALKRIGTDLEGFTLRGLPEIGWKDETHAYFLPDATLSFVNAELKAMGEGQPLQVYGLWKRMADEGHIEPKGKELTPKFAVGKGKARIRCLKMPLSALEPPTDPEPDDPDDGPEDAELGERGSGEAGTGDAVSGKADAANSTAAHLPESRPEDSELLGRAAPMAKSQAPQSLTRAADPFNDPSAQMPRSWREGPLMEESERPSAGPMVSPVENVRDISSMRGPSPPDIWASGHRGGPSCSTATAIAGAEDVGTAIDTSDPDRAIVIIVGPDGTSHSLAPSRGAFLGPLEDVLRRATVVGHNLRPGITLLHKHDVQPSRVFDTALAWRLYDGHRHDDDRFFSLANARRHFKQAAPVPVGAREHLEEEARLVLSLHEVFARLLDEDGLRDVAELEFALVPVIAEMEAAGVPVDRTKWQSVTDEWAKAAAQLRTELTWSMGAKNIDNDKEVLAALRHRLGLPIEKTNSEALAPHRDNPIVERLLRYRRLRAFVTSSGGAVLRALDTARDGRVHTTIDQLGARTGRMSCKEPNLMGLPRDPGVRGCIVAPPGKKLVVGDYKAIEMRVIADQTGDEELRAVFNRSGCPHRHTAAMLAEKPEKQITTDEKNRAKPINFGISFGMSSKRLIAYARKNFGVVMTELEAEKFKEKFLEHYTGVRDWQRKTQNEMRSPLRTGSGRTCYWDNTDECYNARLSFPVQGTAADGMKAAMVLLHPRLRGLGARMILVVHDELVVEAPEQHAEAVRALMRECMAAGMKRYVATVPIVVDPEIRSTWAA